MSRVFKVSTQHLIDNVIQTNPEISRNDATAIVQNLLEFMTNNIEQGNSVFLNGIGTIKVKMRAGRVAHNPNTLEKVMVDERKTLVITPSRVIKRIINS